ncbi:hypothetical protein P872_03000 [Rhodonellum psychrophilum GCM71 = DSM 17998]|uniref:Uncharacterized protein n=1 Tax=Rhodonellum psychrophilum GCM71 = DSM 17998 TaxID=1123057 RepID=U5C5X0_9BACT|nr:hypothetical protein P872_03000 [Rhodonellum psychrophilum GCM71 = DSM 17998]
MKQEVNSRNIKNYLNAEKPNYSKFPDADARDTFAYRNVYRGLVSIF